MNRPYCLTISEPNLTLVYNGGKVHAISYANIINEREVIEVSPVLLPSNVPPNSPNHQTSHHSRIHSGSLPYYTLFLSSSLTLTFSYYKNVLKLVYIYIYISLLKLRENFLNTNFFLEEMFHYRQKLPIFISLA
jgi:hypothetical protein